MKEGDGDDDYVGFGCPPKQFQYSKGQSGNPAGRPRKQPCTGDLPSHHLLLEEAYLPISFNEGEKATGLPAIQLLYRSMIRTGIKGNAQCQKLSIELVSKAEAAVHKNRKMEAGILEELRDEYQEQLLKHREMWKQSGHLAWIVIIRQDQQAWDSINQSMAPTEQGQLIGRLTEEELASPRKR